MFSLAKVPTVAGDRGGPGRKTQNCRFFWTRAGSSHLNRVNSHRDRRGVVAKCRTVVASGLALGLRVSKLFTVTGIGGVVVAKRITIVTFGLAPGLRVSKVRTVGGIGGSWSRDGELLSLLDLRLDLWKKEAGAERGEERGER